MSSHCVLEAKIEVNILANKCQFLRASGTGLSELATTHQCKENLNVGQKMGKNFTHLAKSLKITRPYRMFSCLHGTSSEHNNINTYT